MALLDFERISRIDMNVATDCLAAFASMIIGPDRPYYVVCVNVDKTLRLTLDKAFDAAAIVVAIHGSPNSGAGYVMIGDDQKKHRFKAAWEALLSCVQGKPDSNIWVAGRKFEEKRNLKPANVLQHMYLNGVLMRDPDRKPNYRLLYPLASSDTVEP
ncbi:MAG TPA: hypothetical protein VHS78_00880 [Candidatus Elarobacter sp.]|nr:hypothetical protein [Candidatus Elarobacter sp.]